MDSVLKALVAVASLVVIAFGAEHAWTLYSEFNGRQGEQAIAASSERCRKIGEDSELIRTGQQPVFLSTVPEVVTEWDKCRGL
ncbi:hypothetical protein [Rhizobium johnstonii]|uniref:hypothetical protein n=1 Tax=Rhizobium johnstonii TaxID=3019933 RepID=UPI003F96BE9D